MAIPKELKWTVKGLSSRVKLSRIASQSLTVGTIRRQSNQSRERREKARETRSEGVRESNTGLNVKSTEN